MIPPLLKYPFYGSPTKNYYSYSSHSRSKASIIFLC
jgi:hypothetical protein